MDQKTKDFYGGPPQSIKSLQKYLSEKMAKVIKSQDEKKDWKAAHDMQQKLVIALELEKIHLQKENEKLAKWMETSYSEASSLKLEKIELQKKLEELAARMEIFYHQASSLNAQEIGKELGLIIGTEIYPHILPAIKDLKNTLNDIWVELNGGKGFSNYKVWDFVGQEKNIAPMVKCLVERCHKLQKEILEKRKTEKTLGKDIVIFDKNNILKIIEAVEECWKSINGNDTNIWDCELGLESLTEQVKNIRSKYKATLDQLKKANDKIEDLQVKLDAEKHREVIDDFKQISERSMSYFNEVVDQRDNLSKANKILEGEKRFFQTCSNKVHENIGKMIEEA